MTRPLTSFPAEPAMRRHLEAAYPGASDAVHMMREQVVEFCTSPTARTVFLGGPSGIGKSTVARHIALLKAHGLSGTDDPDPLKPEHVRYTAPNLIDHRILEGYIELPLTGLVESLAEAQLFGVAKGAYTGAVSDRKGVFEMAAAASEKTPEGRITGGVVFLDEVGDLSPTLQSKLLPVLSHGVVYRVGGEGDTKHQIEYHGVVITASWKPLTTALRPDLVQRLTTHVIDVPGLERRGEDLPQIVESLATSAIDRFQAYVNRVAAPSADRAPVATGPLRSLAASLRQPDADTVRQLCNVDWSVHGQLRGLANAVEKIVVQGRDPVEVIATMPRIDRTAPPARSILRAVLLAAAEGKSLADCVRDVEMAARHQLKSDLDDEPTSLSELASILGIPESDLRKQVNNLLRDRRAR